MSEANYNKTPLNASRSKIKSLIVSPPDKTLLAAVMFLIIIGFMAIFSATGPKCLSDGVSPFIFLQKQVNANLNSPVSAYILATYRSRFIAEDYTLFKNKIVADYRKLLE